MTKVNVRFLVDQKTNYGPVMEGEEKLIPEEAADLFVKRGIAEYVMKDTIPSDPVFDMETMDALLSEYPEEVFQNKKGKLMDTKITETITGDGSGEKLPDIEEEPEEAYEVGEFRLGKEAREEVVNTETTETNTDED